MKRKKIKPRCRAYGVQPSKLSIYIYMRARGDKVNGKIERAVG